MNRLPSIGLLDDDPLTQVRGRQISLEDSPVEALADQTLFAPLHYEPNYSYPLLIWLHDAGQCERELNRIMPAISMRNYVAVAPRGPCSLPHDFSRDSFDWTQTASYVEVAVQRILHGIQQAQVQYNVHRDRIFLAGAGNGGTMAFRVALSHPHLFRGVLSLGGSFPQGDTPLARLHEARRLPLFLASYRDCQVYPESHVCANLRLLHAAGMSVTLRQYPGNDKTGNQIALADVDRWIMDTIAGDHEVSVVSS